MNTRARNAERFLHVSPRWAWVSLVPVLACACKSPDLVCEGGAYFQVLQPEQGAGVAPFSIERLGPKMGAADLAHVPDILTLTSNTRVIVSWDSGDLFMDSKLIFSPGEGIARNVSNPDDVYPMRRFSVGVSERVRFGFRSPTCRTPRRFGICDMRNDNLFLAAEWTCHPDRSR